MCEAFLNRKVALLNLHTLVEDQIIHNHWHLIELIVVCNNQATNWQLLTAMSMKALWGPQYSRLLGAFMCIQSVVRVLDKSSVSLVMQLLRARKMSRCRPTN